MDLYILPNVKQVTSGKQPHSTGRSAQCFVTTQGGGIRRVGGRHKREGIWQYMYMLFIFFSIIVYYKILNTVLCTIQQVLVAYLFYIEQCVYVNPNLLIYSSLPPFPFGNHKFVFYVCESVNWNMNCVSINFLKFTKVCFVAQHVIYPGVCSMCT